MKKFITILLFFVFTSQFAQNEFGVQVSGGLSKLFPTFYDDNESENTHETAKMAFLIGFYYEKNFTDKVGMGVGLNFNQTNSFEKYDKGTIISDIKEIEIKKQISEIGIPLYLKINASEKFNLNMGFRPGILVGSKLNYKYIDNDNVVTTREDKFSELSSLKIGGQFGLGYKITPKLGIEALYYKDLHNTLNKESKDEGFELKSWQILLGIRYVVK